jgi:hypothetical protein
MGIESGNLDILLSVLYGLMLFLQRLYLKSKKRFIYPLILWAAAGSMPQTKLFLLPIVVVFLFAQSDQYFLLYRF